MRRWFERLPIHRKLVASALLITAVALVIATLGLGAFDVWRYRVTAAEDAEALASVLVAVREVISGRTYLSPGMASEVISNVVLTKARPGGMPTDQLTDRELEILERIGQGEEVKAIAEALHLSPKTVETHRAHIKEKLHLKNAREVARFAVQWSTAKGI